MRTLEEVRSILRQHQHELHERYGVKSLRIFGSYARGEQTPESDLDLLARFTEGASLFDLVGLEDYLEAILGCKVDILSERAIRPEIRENILRDLVRL